MEPTIQSLKETVGLRVFSTIGNTFKCFIISQGRVSVIKRYLQPDNTNLKIKQIITI